MAEVEIPTGYGMFVAQLTIDGRTNPYNITGGYTSVSGSADPDVSAEEIYEALTDTTGGTAPPFAGNRMQTNWTFRNVIVYERPATLLLRGESPQGPTAGTVPTTNAGMIVSSTYRVSKRTAQVGRHFRGRFYPPFMLAENLVDQRGLIDSSELAIARTAWNLFRTRMLSLSRDLVLLHAPVAVGPTIPPTVITSLFVQPQVGTQRRRLR